MLKYRRVAIVVCLIAAVLAGEWVYLRTQDRTPEAVAGPVIGAYAAAPHVQFDLIDHSGKSVRDSDFRGSYVLLLFGYTFCPDVCPTSLQNISLALDRLGPLAEQVEPLFITIDPDRDGPEVLARYVAAFHPRIIGLTGTPEQIKQAAVASRVFYAKFGDGADYLMDHSAFIFLIDPEGRTVTYFPHDASPETLATQIADFLEERT